MIIVTGGAGFIGSNFILNWFNPAAVLNQSGNKNNVIKTIVNIDKLTYAGKLSNLDSLKNDARHIFVKADINHKKVIEKLFQEYKPEAVIHFAAESHVDNSIAKPAAFIKTNIAGTFNLLETAKQYWQSLEKDKKDQFRFLHISTDEVYGSLNEKDAAFTEAAPYAPNSPYAASKAAADHLARAYCHTYGLPVITTNCSNNYGPYQFPEKLIPLLILNALAGKPLPIYGDGLNIRDWLYVADHCKAVNTVLEKGQPGETYNIGGGNERTNIQIACKICEMLDALKPLNDSTSYRQFIQYVKDRPGHDKRYAINSTKITNALGWTPKENFESGLYKTVLWHVQHVEQKIQRNSLCL